MISLNIHNSGTGEFRQVQIALDQRQQPFSIGRSPASNLILVAPDVSRIHAALQLESDGYELSDRHSTCGTYLNRDLIQPLRNYTLQVGDCIEIGSFIIDVQSIELPTQLNPTNRIYPIRLPMRIPSAY